MKDERFTASKALLDIIGQEWDGEFVVRRLSAVDVMQLGDEMIDEMRKLGKDIQLVPIHRMNNALMRKATTFNGKPLPPDNELPAKLVELLMEPAMKLNALTIGERQALFLPSTRDPNRPTEQPR